MLAVINTKWTRNLTLMSANINRESQKAKEESLHRAQHIINQPRGL
jgi:hypothetical protein